MWELISATPSPYARKIRVALAEKGLPFKLVTEVPWDSTTKTPDHNPLEKLPILLLNDDTDPVYESHYIFEWLEAKYPTPSLMPEDLDDRLFAKKVEVVCDGICDALVLTIFERLRDEDKQSKPWYDRQIRKVEGGLKALATFVDCAKGNGEFLLDDRLTLADIAIMSVLGWMTLRRPDIDWQTKYPRLKQYFDRLDRRESFALTQPSVQTMKDKVV